MALYVVLGRKGMGKTLFLTRQAKNSEREVWANYKLYINERFKPLSISGLINLPHNILVLIDEAYTWFESRISSSVLNRYISYIIFQLRKTNTHIYMSAQRFSTLDYRIRIEADVLVKCERKNNGVQPEDKLPNGLLDGFKVPYYYFWDYKYSFFDMESYKETSYILPYEKAKQYFDIYDTKEVIDPAFKEQMELELLRDNPKELFKKVKKVANEIRNDLNEITHDTIKIALLKNGYSGAYESLVFNLLKGKVEL
jgi:hypothetical protein